MDFAHVFAAGGCVSVPNLLDEQNASKSECQASSSRRRSIVQFACRATSKALLMFSELRLLGSSNLEFLGCDLYKAIC